MVACFRQGYVVLPCTEQLRAKDLRLRLDVARPAARRRRRAQRRGPARARLGRARRSGCPARRLAASATPPPARRARPRGPVPDHVHERHRRRAEGRRPRPALPRRPAPAGRALARRAPGRARLVHGRQRLEQVGAQRLHRAVDPRRRGAAARRALRPRRAPGDARRERVERAVHGADRVPRDRQARRSRGRRRRCAAWSPPARRSTPRCCAPGTRRPACGSATATARPRPAS